MAIRWAMASDSLRRRLSELEARGGRSYPVETLRAPQVTAQTALEALTTLHVALGEPDPLLDACIAGDKVARLQLLECIPGMALWVDYHGARTHLVTGEPMPK